MQPLLKVVLLETDPAHYKQGYISAREKDQREAQSKPSG